MLPLVHMKHVKIYLLSSGSAPPITPERRRQRSASQVMLALPRRAQAARVCVRAAHRYIRGRGRTCNAVRRQG